MTTKSKQQECQFAQLRSEKQELKTSTVANAIIRCCGASKNDGTLHAVDASVHVMLKHDKKVARHKGEAPKGYVPRAPHPMLQHQPQEGQHDQQSSVAKNGATGGERKPIVASQDE